MRVFVGIQFSSALKDDLEAYQAKLADWSEKGRLTRKENFHLTLCFIGEISETDYVQLFKQLSEKLAKTDHFSLLGGECGYFIKKNRYIPWVGVLLTADLLAVFKKVEAVIKEMGLAVEDRPYTPHVTMARQVVLLDEEKWCHQPVAFNECVSQVTLFQSHQVDGQLAYTPLNHILLNKQKS